jgi:hypothetical protein
LSIFRGSLSAGASISGGRTAFSCVHLRESSFPCVSTLWGTVYGPTKALKIILRDKQFTAPYSVSDIQKIANRFSVSREVIIRRLLSIGKISNIEYDTYTDLFNQELEQERERQQIARKQGIKIGIPQSISRDAIDRTSPSVSKMLYHGFSEEVYSKQDVARHLSIDQKHIDKFLMEVSKWIR